MLYICAPFPQPLQPTPVFTPIEHQSGQEPGPQGQTVRVQIPGHLFAGCVTLTLV